MNKLSIADCEQKAKRIDFTKTERGVYTQLADTMRENERLRAAMVQAVGILDQRAVDICRQALHPYKESLPEVMAEFGRIVRGVSDRVFGDPYSSPPPVQPCGKPTKT